MRACICFVCNVIAERTVLTKQLQRKQPFIILMHDQPHVENQPRLHLPSLHHVIVNLAQFTDVCCPGVCLYKYHLMYALLYVCGLQLKILYYYVSLHILVKVVVTFVPQLGTQCYISTSICRNA